MLEKNLFEKVAEFHGHKCPGLAIGFKASEGAISELGLDSSKIPAIDEEIVCVTENDACGVDAIQVLLGCTFGKSNLITRIRGKQAFSFFNRNTGDSVRLILKSNLNEGMSREEFQEFLITTPYKELFNVSHPSFDLPETARLFNSEDCSVCGESTAEFALRIQNGQPVCIDCYDSYEREGF
jgi:formylmethanofuran dehydrogenase subunit E